MRRSLAPLLAFAAVTSACTVGLPGTTDSVDAGTMHPLAQALGRDELVGQYDTNWGPLTLSVADNGTGLVGYYGTPSEPSRFGEGRLAGTVSGARFTYIWVGDDSGKRGRGYFERGEAGRAITGTWGYGDSDTDGGSWAGTRR